MARYLDPKSDLVFKRIFGEHPHLLKSFLNAVLPLEQDGLIEEIEYLTAEQVPVIPTLKRTIVDVKCQDEKGRIFIVEMQLEWTTTFMQRMLFNASQAYVKQLVRGEEYKLLYPVYGLGLVNAVFDRETSHWYHHYKMLNVQDLNKEIQGLQLVFSEIPKFQAKKIADKKLQILWLRFLSEIGEKTREVGQDFLDVPEIEEALHYTEEAAYTEAELEGYERYWDAISTEKTLLSAKLEEGLAQDRRRIAKDLLQDGYPLEKIIKLTRLTKDELGEL